MAMQSRAASAFASLGRAYTGATCRSNHKAAACMPNGRNGGAPARRMIVAREGETGVALGVPGHSITLIVRAPFKLPAADATSNRVVRSSGQHAL
ncbi:MAG: hypothetical protein U1E70_10580 [Acetobacteraceae bacterium]|nr:hypothetical protein [Pseudomonadota bacterium]